MKGSPVPDKAPAEATAPIVIPTLPTWTDPASVATYITSIVSIGIGVMAALGDSSKAPIVQAMIPCVSIIVAATAQLVNVITHRGVQKAAIHAAASNIW